MIGRWWAALVCRATGIYHRESQPSSKDLMKEMRNEGRRVDVKTFELRRQREDLNKTFGGRPR